MMRSLKTEEMEFPPIEKVKLAHIFTKPSFQAFRDWLAKGKGAKQLLAEAAQAGAEGIRRVYVHLEEDTPGFQVEWGGMAPLMLHVQGKSIQCFWWEVERGCIPSSEADLVADWARDRVNETSILLSGDTETVGQAVALLEESCGTHAMKKCLWTIAVPNDEAPLPRFPFKKEGYIGLVLLTTENLVPSRMCMLLDTNMSVMPILAALMALPKGDGTRDMIWMPHPKRPKQQVIQWIAQIFMSGQNWQPSLVYPAEPLSGFETSAQLQKELVIAERSSPSIEWQVKKLFSLGYVPSRPTEVAQVQTPSPTKEDTPVAAEPPPPAAEGSQQSQSSSKTGSPTQSCQATRPQETEGTPITCTVAEHPARHGASAPPHQSHQRQGKPHKRRMPPQNTPLGRRKL